MAYSGNTAEACVFYLTSLFPFSAQHESLIFFKKMCSLVTYINLITVFHITKCHLTLKLGNHICLTRLGKHYFFFSPPFFSTLSNFKAKSYNKHNLLSSPNLCEEMSLVCPLDRGGRSSVLLKHMKNKVLSDKRAADVKIGT